MIVQGRRRFAAVKTKEATLVANVKQYAMMRAMQNEGKTCVHDGMPTEVDGRSPGTSRQMCQ